jgi:hypothetical protein
VRHHALCATTRCARGFAAKNVSHYYSQRTFFAKGVSQIIVHCHPQRSTPRSARRYAASNDSPFYSTRFLRLGERAPSISELQYLQEKRKPRRS